MKFGYFWRNNYILTKAIAKKSAFQKIRQENALAKQAYFYTTNLNKNRKFQKINLEKCVNFAYFRLIKCIFTQPIIKKGASFADFIKAKVYLRNQSRKKVQVLPIFDDIIAYAHNQQPKKKAVMHLKKIRVKKRRKN